MQQDFLKNKYSIIAMSIISGILSALMLPGFGFFISGIFGLSLFYIALSKVCNLKIAFLSGWLFGFFYFLVGLYWIGNALLVDGNPYKWAYPLAVAGLPFLLAFYFAFSCLIINKLSDLNKISGFLLFTLIIGIFEYLRSILFTGFPWNLFAYGFSEFNSFIQIINITGLYIFNFICIALLAVSGYLLICKSNKHKIIISLSTICLIILLQYVGNYKKENNYSNFNSSFSIAVVQANIPQKDKWKDSLIKDNFLKYIEISKNIKHDNKTTLIIIWPETALHYQLYNNEFAKKKIKELLDQYESDAYLITGTLIVENKDITNSLIVFNKKAEKIALYDKSHLVPFGEYMPFSNIIDLSPITNFIGMKSGNGLKDIKISNDVPSFSPLICYEIIFPDKVIKNNSNAKWIINVTNDAWYGISAGPYQHLAQAKFRAIEENLYVIRAASTGISAIINNKGEIINKIDLEKDGYIIKTLGSEPYTNE